MQHRRGSLARASASVSTSITGFSTAGIVEYHPSMSLDGPATVAVAHPRADPLRSPHPPQTASRPPHHAVDTHVAPPTLAAVLATRASLWDRVNTLIESLETTNVHGTAYASEVDALRHLQQLHFLCNILFHARCFLSVWCIECNRRWRVSIDHFNLFLSSQQRETHVRTLQLAAHRQLSYGTSTPSAD